MAHVPCRNCYVNRPHGPDLRDRGWLIFECATCGDGEYFETQSLTTSRPGQPVVLRDEPRHCRTATYIEEGQRCFLGDDGRVRPVEQRRDPLAVSPRPAAARAG